jgi:2'-5' RNA ligase
VTGLTVLSMTVTGSRTALIVEVPEAEHAVARYRERLDASARLGVPAHITVLFPFMPLEKIGPGVRTELERLFAAVRSFRFQLDRTAWFGEEVLWLAPRDPAPFRALTRSVAEAFPGFPPYEGEFADSVPHLTVGHGHSVSDLRAAEESVRAHLPIDAQATHVVLLTRQSSWRQWARAGAFPLGGRQDRLGDVIMSTAGLPARGPGRGLGPG